MKTIQSCTFTYILNRTCNKIISPKFCFILVHASLRCVHQVQALEGDGIVLRCALIYFALFHTV